MNLAAVELDPNQLTAVVGAVIVAVIGLYGVMIANGRSLRVVKEQTKGGNGAPLGEDVYSILKKMERLTAESDERWKVTLSTADNVSQIYSNQVVALSAAQDLMQKIAALTQSQVHTDQRLTLLETHATRELSEMRETVRTLQRQIDTLTSASDGRHLTPPKGIPATVPGTAPYPGPLDPQSV